MILYPTRVEVTSIDEKTRTAFVSLTIKNPYDNEKTLAEDLLTSWPIVLEYSRAEDKTVPLILTLRIKEKHLEINSIKFKSLPAMHSKKRFTNKDGYLTFITDEELNLSNIFFSKEAVYENIYETGINTFTGIYRYESDRYPSICKTLISQFIYDEMPNGIDKDHLYKVLAMPDFKKKFKEFLTEHVEYLIEPANEKNNIAPPLYIFYYRNIEVSEYLLGFTEQQAIREILLQQLP